MGERKNEQALTSNRKPVGNKQTVGSKGNRRGPVLNLHTATFRVTRQGMSPYGWSFDAPQAWVRSLTTPLMVIWRQNAPQKPKKNNESSPTSHADWPRRP